MIIKGQVFDFSPLNANDLERMDAAQEHMHQANALEKQRPHTGAADILRGQCRLVMDYLDELLGEGAASRLGLDGNDFGACVRIVDEIKQAIEAEKAEVKRVTSVAQPVNRAQRRAEKNARQRTRTAGRIVSFQPAAQMAERVDKAARRKALLAELAALDDE